MKKALIHQTAEERIAGNGDATIAELRKTNAELVAGYERMQKKLDEIKSANLVANRELKKISGKEAPTNMKMELINKPNDLATAFFSMLKGDKGDSPTREELLSLITPLIPEPIKGDKGDRGDDAITISSLKPKDVQKGYLWVQEPSNKLFQFNGKGWVEIGKNGHTPTVAELNAIIKPLIPAKAKDGRTPVKGVDYFDGKNGSPDTPDEVVVKINSSKKIIDAERVRGLTKAFELLEKYGTNPEGKATGGGRDIRILANGSEVSQHVTEIDFTTNLSVTYSNNGKLTVTATSGAGTNVETPTGTINGSNTAFTVSNEPKWVLVNGVTYFSGVGYSYAGGTITLDFAPVTGSWIRSIY